MSTFRKMTLVFATHERKIQYLLLVLLSIFTIKMGVIPAWNSINSDFPNYYVSAKLLTESADFKRIYDDSWFNAKIRENGIVQQGKFSPFPPATAFVLLPLTPFSPLTAKRIWTICNIFLLGANIWLLKKIAGWQLISSAIFLLLSGIGLINNFRFGQLYLLLLFVILLSYVCVLQRRQTAAGMLLGLGAAVKYVPVVYLVGFAVNRKWLTFFAGVLALVGVTVIEIIVFGSDVYRYFFAEVLLPHLDGRISAQDPYAIAFQSWNTFFRHVFLADAASNPVPLIGWPAGYRIAKMLVTFAITALSGYSMWQLHRTNHPNRRALDFAIIGIAAMLLLPATATYHFLLLAFPVALLLSHLCNESAFSAKSLIFGSYAAIGFVTLIPFTKWQYSGWEILLAFPRLWLMTFLFGVTIWTICNDCQHER